MDKPELNTVISWLEGLTWDDWSDYHSGSAVQNIAKSALELLKKQEPKMVQSIRTVAYRTLGYCPSCGRGLDSYRDGNNGEHITHFCYNCGQAVKWK